jgi:hypothetical protein
MKLSHKGKNNNSSNNNNSLTNCDTLNGLSKITLLSYRIELKVPKTNFVTQDEEESRA